MNRASVLALAASALCGVLILLSGRQSGASLAAPRQQAASRPAIIHVRLGTWVESSRVSAPELAGRGLRASSRVTAPATAQDRLFVFPLFADQRNVLSASMRVITSTTLLTDAILVTLEVYGPTGDLARTISTTPIDAAAGPADGWTALPLAADAAARRVEPDELLVARVRLNPAAAYSTDLAFDIALVLPSVGAPSATPTPPPTSTSTPTSTPTQTPAPTVAPSWRIWLPLVAAR